MFTGIIEEIGTIRTINRGAASAVLTIAAETVLKDVHLGDSIAVNGVCLTAVNVCAAESHLASGIAESLNHSVGIGNRHHYTAARKFKLHDSLTVSGWRQTVGSASARLCGGIFFKFFLQIIVSHSVAVIRSRRSPRHERRR